MARPPQKSGSRPLLVSALIKTKKRVPRIAAQDSLERRRRPTLPHCGAVPSARPGLTSLFGMGRGGTPGPKPPECACPSIGWTAERKRRGKTGKLNGTDPRGAPRTRPEMRAGIPRLAPPEGGGKAVGQLVLLGCGRRRPCTCSLSTSSSSTALRDLILRPASRLDAFSAYPIPAWIPCGAPGGTTGRPEAGPSRSSRTSDRAAQVSCARDR